MKKSPNGTIKKQIYPYMVFLSVIPCCSVIHILWNCHKLVKFHQKPFIIQALERALNIQQWASRERSRDLYRSEEHDLNLLLNT